MWGGGEKVDAGVDGGGEEHEQPELLPHPQPGVEPGGEARVLCPPAGVDILTRRLHLASWRYAAKTPGR